jgi:hypothetical protein
MAYKSGDPEFDSYIAKHQKTQGVRYNDQQLQRAHQIYHEEMAKHATQVDQQVNIGLFFTPPDEQKRAVQHSPNTTGLQAAEAYMLQGLPELMEKHKVALERETTEVQTGKAVNALFPGRVRILGTQNGKVIEINNKADTDILSMRVRKDFLDPLVRAEMAKPDETLDEHESQFDWN